MRSPVSCELGTCSISSESSPSTIWGAAAIPPGLHEPVWAELDRHALRLFGPRRKPVREGQGLLRKQRRRTDPPIAGLAPSRRYLAGVAKRYCARPPQPRRASRHDLDRLVDPHGLIAQARSQSGVAPVGTRQSRTRGVPRRSEAAWPLDGVAARPPPRRPPTAASAAAEAAALPRLPKGKTMCFRASVRAEVGRMTPGVSKSRRRRSDWINPGVSQARREDWKT